MLQTVPDILAKIVAHKRLELAERTLDLRSLEQAAAASVTARRGFRRALDAAVPAIIAEIKKASPSKGLLSDSFDPPAIAQTYARGGAAALSVLTDARFFQGGLADLRAARSAVALPALRKDFTIDSLDVIEAAAGGADAILLIAAILTDAELRRFRELAESYGMDALVEVHDADELDRALDSGATIAGVNNRDLAIFKTDLGLSERLIPLFPKHVIAVSESGIHTAADAARVRAAGAHAVLVGEALMKAPDPAALIASFRP